VTIALFALCVLSGRSILRDQTIWTDLRAPPIIVHRNSAYASLDPLDIVGLPLIPGAPNPGIAESLLTVSMSTVGLV
jgi:hypothetical protein